MRSHPFIYLLQALFIFLVTISASAADRPNIIFILADDLGIGDLSCYGGTIVKTPNIDRLAKEGTRFTQFYSAAPICSPSRAALITGQNPGRWRINSFLQTRRGNRGCEQADFLDPAAPSLPRHLKAAGYSTAHIGKWHLGGGRDVQNVPKFAAYGYDEGIGTYESPEPHPEITGTNWIWSAHDPVKRWNRTAFFVDKTLDFLARKKGAQPSFVNLWLDDPHTPWLPGADAPKGDTLANLRKVLSENDHQVGRLLQGLRDLALEQNTIVVFTSDNGPLPTFRGRRNVDLRGSKLTLYEGGIRMPFIARWPGHIPAGRTDDQSVLSALDLFPTFSALAGVVLPEAVAFDGQDMSAALRGTPSAERKAPLIWEYGRNDEWFKYPAQDRSPNVAIRDGPWKLLVNADGTKSELYDVLKDRGEKTNRAPDHPELTAQLSGKAIAWRKLLPAPAAPLDNTVSAPAHKPNIVVFLTDDQDQLDSSVYGDRKVHTPNMARLAAAGITFTHAFAASPSCAPSRAALLTGLMPARNGAEANHSRPRPEIKKLPAYLKELGYEVVSFGKVAHYGHAKEYGFDHVEFEAFHDHRGIDTAVAFLQNRAATSSRPLCIFVGTHWPHRPWPESPGQYNPAQVDIPPHLVDTTVTRSFRARYYNAVSKADDYLGKIYDAATKHLGNNTLFLMSSDHGAQWPLGKWNLYDAGIRVPLIAAWPGVIKPASSSAALVSWVDILPTLIEAAGGNAPSSGLALGQIDGRSFLPVLRGATDQHRDRIFATHSGDKEMNVYPIRAVRTSRWKYIWNLHPEFQHTTHVDRAQVEDEVGYWRSWERAAAAGDTHATTVIQRYRQRPSEELYDLDADPFERRNLAADPSHSSRREALRVELNEWMQNQRDQKKVYNQPLLLESSALP